MSAGLRSRRRDEGIESLKIYERDKSERARERGREVLYRPYCRKVLAKPGLERMVSPVEIGA
jgi:hypothetical protein